MTRCATCRHSGELAARAELGLSTLQLPPLDDLPPLALDTRHSSTAVGPENAFDEQVPPTMLHIVVGVLMQLLRIATMHSHISCTCRFVMLRPATSIGSGPMDFLHGCPSAL